MCTDNNNHAAADHEHEVHEHDHEHTHSHEHCGHSHTHTHADGTTHTHAHTHSHAAASSPEEALALRSEEDLAAGRDGGEHLAEIGAFIRVFGLGQVQIPPPASQMDPGPSGVVADGLTGGEETGDLISAAGVYQKVGDDPNVLRSVAVDAVGLVGGDADCFPVHQDIR